MSGVLASLFFIKGQNLSKKTACLVPFAQDAIFWIIIKKNSLKHLAQGSGSMRRSPLDQGRGSCQPYGRKGCESGFILLFLGAYGAMQLE